MSDASISLPLKIRRLQIEDIDPNRIALMVAAVGYERRSPHAAETLAERRVIDLGQRLFLLRFKGHTDRPSRKDADRRFAALSPFADLWVDPSDGLLVREHTRTLIKAALRVGRSQVVVDYSSMSRMLYLCLLDLLEAFPTLEFVFIYSAGLYETAPSFPVSCVGDIRGVPGLEGLAFPTRPRLYVLGLGYDGIGTMALIERLEAERFVVFWTDPGVHVPEGARTPAEIVCVRNASLIRRASGRFTTDVRDVEGTYREICRIAHGTQSTHKLVLAPVGPKPHVLASALAATTHRHATLVAPHLGDGGLTKELPEIAAEGELIITGVRAADAIENGGGND
jgi:hypothetical protein